MSDLEKAIKLAKELLQKLASNKTHYPPQWKEACVVSRALLSLAEENEILKADRLATPTEFAHAIDASIIAKLRAQESELTALKSELAEAEKVIGFYNSVNADNGGKARDYLAKRKGKA